MTIKRRLLISHLVMFVTPILMMAVILLSALAGIFLFARSGNHVYIESADQFGRAADLMTYAVFHQRQSASEIDHTASYAALIQMLDPVQNYVVLEKEDVPIFTYGNAALEGRRRQLPAKDTLHELDRKDKGSYILAEDNQYVFLQKRTFEGVPYYLYFLSAQVHHGSDDRLEKFSAGTLIFIGLAMLCVILATSWFLAEFMIHRLMPPLLALKAGAEQIQKGDLDLHLVYKEKDEFSPVFSAFGLMARELAQSLRARSQEEASRKELIASISHDIRTPLTAIKAYVEGLLDGVAGTEERRQHYLRIIQKKTDELDAMIEQLFLLSKMDVGDRAVPLEPLDLSACLMDITDEGREPFQKKGMTLVIEHTEPVRIAGNALLLRRIFLNLWENSAKYKNGETGTIRMALTRAGDEVRLTVSDDGPGVPEESLPHLFEAFYRTDKARSQTANGSGLGLAVVSRAMAQMHGTVRAEAVKPHGLRITMVWPVWKNGAQGLCSAGKE